MIEAGISNDEIEDLKITLSRERLVSIFGSEQVVELGNIFKDGYDEIILRRCQAHGKFIRFHTDVSLKTMQISINGDSEYQGGRLVYATQGKFRVIKKLKLEC